ncbi:hypothetical protein QE370_000428 [Aeromicrobium sp. SORGH_AS981]|uniref:hypothetical protein n=1 Tax=Aeromicrobium sp. SORGH_AS_0981 TaxID=3041802 RepID=UPI00285D6DCE|nr:hypothetical protein [Aeromicrobium sp. SORGH_AS_0981]MDR6117244.1 hypothetical protein [Aeromicrobium sp. SORGH_AS_0981]
MTDRITYAALEDRDWLRPSVDRRNSLFSAAWSDTASKLCAEVDAISDERGGLITIALDVLPGQLKVNGTGLKANQAPSTPAVEVTFDTQHGPVRFRADAYTRTWGRIPPWRDNVRAVALTLEYLRAVDRHGAADHGQQYGGFLALEAGTGAVATGGMTRDQAEQVLTEWSHFSGDRLDVNRLRIARRNAHPDRNGGDQSGWDRVEQAARVLGLD